MLKHDIKNYFRQFTKTLTHTDLVLCNYFDLNSQISVQDIEFFQIWPTAFTRPHITHFERKKIG